MTNDDLIEKLGKSQQRVMSLTVENRALKRRMVENRALKRRMVKAENRAEVLEELVMDIVADIQDGVLKSVILKRIGKIMQKLDGEDM